MNVMDEARSLIYGDRHDDYGAAEHSFATIAGLWTTYLRGKRIIGADDEVTTVDVAMLMALLKISRHATGGTKRDSIVDLIGYAALAGDLAGFGEAALTTGAFRVETTEDKNLLTTVVPRFGVRACACSNAGPCSAHDPNERIGG